MHNGSLSNPYGMRRMLEPRGIHFETDNDTEAACRFLEWRLREGDELELALQKGFEELDGFYTFLMGTPDKLALIRDPFACKPAVVAETDDYVAIASEFRSLAHLPGIKNATYSNQLPRRCTYGKCVNFDLANIPLRRAQPVPAPGSQDRQASARSPCSIRTERTTSRSAWMRRSRSKCMGHAGYYAGA